MQYPPRNLPAALKMRRLYAKIEVLEEEIWRLKIAAGEVMPAEGFLGVEMQKVFELIDERAGERASIGL